MKKQKQEQTGQVNFVWALAGGYLIYLGGKLLYLAACTETEPTATTPVLVVIPAAAVFIGVGFWLLRREWKAYQFGAAHKDDPPPGTMIRWKRSFLRTTATRRIPYDGTAAGGADGQRQMAGGLYPPRI